MKWAEAYSRDTEFSMISDDLSRLEIREANNATGFITS